MLIYILLILLTLLYWYIGYKDKNKITKYFIILCIVFTCISFFRYAVGTDYVDVYLLKFDKVKLVNYDYHLEKLFLDLNRLFIKYKLTGVNLLQFCSIITIPLFFIFIKNNLKKEYWFLGALIFIISTIYFATFNTVRQYLAISLMLFGLDFLKNKKYFLYLLCIIIAIGFHYSSIVGITYFIFYLLFKNGKKDKILKILYIISVLFIFIDIWNILVSLKEYILPHKYYYFLEPPFHRKYSSILKIFVPNILLILLFKEKDKLKNNKDFYLYFIGMFCYVVINNIFYGISLFMRILLFFECFLIIVIPKLKEYYDHNKTFKFKKLKINNFNKIFTVLIICYYLTLTVLRIFISYGHNVVPYQSIFMFWGSL